MPDPTIPQISPDDFRFCSGCGALNLAAAKECRTCRGSDLISYREKKRQSTSETGSCIGIVLMLVGAVVALSGVGAPVGTPLIGLGWIIWRRKVGVPSDRFRRDFELRAQHLLRELAQEQAEDSKSAFEVGLTAFREGRFDTAVEAFAKSAALGLKGAGLSFMHAASLYNAGNLEQASDEFLALHSADRGSPILAVCASMAALRSNRLREPFLQVHLQAMSRLPASARNRLLNALADDFRASRRCDAIAHMVYEDRCRAHPADGALKTALARCLLAKGDTPGAIQAAGEARQLSADPGDATEIMARAFAAETATSDQAVEAYREQLRRDAGNELLRELLIQALLSRGEAHGAVDVARLGMEVNPTPTLRYTLALALIEAGDTSTAVAQLQLLLAADDAGRSVPRPQIIKVLGRAFEQQALLQLAMRQYLQLPPGRERNDLLYDVGRRLETSERSEDQDAARRSFEEIFAADATYRDVAARLGLPAPTRTPQAPLLVGDSKDVIGHPNGCPAARACEKCGQPNRPQARFCAHCGQRLERP